MRSDYRLKKLYKELNKKYFKNSLPNIPVVFCTPEVFRKNKWEDYFEKKEMGKTTVAITLFDDNRPVTVALKKNKNNNYPDIKISLLHEMVHVYTCELDCEKEVFKKEIRRLMLEGAYDDVL